MEDKLFIKYRHKGAAVRMIVCLAGGHSSHAARCEDNLAHEGEITKQKK
jgi:hypothetical protein